MLAPYIEGHERGPFFDLTLRSLDLYDEWIERIRADSGVDVEYRRCGTLEVAARRCGGGADAPPGIGRRSDRAMARSRSRPREERSLPESTRGALGVAMHGYVAVPSLTEALAWAALRHGAEIESHRRIARIEADGTVLRVTRRGRDGMVSDHGRRRRRELEQQLSLRDRRLHRAVRPSSRTTAAAQVEPRSAHPHHLGA